MFNTQNIHVFLRKNDRELRQMVLHIASQYGMAAHLDDIVQNLYYRFLNEGILERYDENLTKISTYLYLIILSTVVMFCRSEMRSHRGMVSLDSFESPEEQDQFLHSNRVGTRDTFEQIEGLSWDLRLFGEYLNERDHRYSLERSKTTKKGRGCRLFEVYDFLQQGLSKREIAGIFGCSEMFVIYMKREIGRILMRYGFDETPAEPRRRRTRHDRNQMPTMSLAA